MSAITGTTRLACLLGSPVSHSISPLIHNFSFQYLGIDCAYLAFDINEQNLKEAVEGLKALHVLGFNLTMPNKNKILEYLDDLSDAARLIGAVNTVENREGRLIGREHFYMTLAGDEEPGDILREFITQFYSGTPYLPKVPST